MASLWRAVSPVPLARLTAFCATLLSLATVSAMPAAASPCTHLSGLSLPETTITAAQDIPAGTFAAQADLPAFCRVTAILTPTADSSIAIEVWMPSSGWNGRFEGLGGGGYQGVIRYDEMGPALRQGYAVANTDEGTGASGCSPLYCGGAGNQGNPLAIAFGEPAAPTVGLFGHPERIKDFGWRAMHLMTVRSKSIVKAYFVRPAHHSYFSGCSTGGQNALMEAQRFPEDYDGILAGAPAHNRTHLHTVLPWDWQRAHATADCFVVAEQMTLIYTAVLAQCAGRDGGLRSDGFLTDPRDCGFDPGLLQCSGGNTPPNCLTPDQVGVIRKYYAGPSNPRTHALINPGNARGSEASTVGALGFILNEFLPEPAFDGLFYWVFGASFGDPASAHNYQNFDFDRDIAIVDHVLAADLNATSTDLSAFREHGGKLVMYHGWADPLIPSQSSINYFNAVAATDEDDESRGDDARGGGAFRHTQEYFRLFMAPGTYHCGSGPGPNVFGGAFNQGGPVDADHNALTALAEWVELGVAPERIIATKFVDDNPAHGIAMERPLCVYPKVAIYNGTGDPTSAASFVCRRDEPDVNPTPAPQYGP